MEENFFNHFEKLVVLFELKPVALIYGGLIKQSEPGQWPARKCYGTVKDIRTRMNYRQLPVLETERLILRPVSADDIHDVYEYAKNPVVSYYLPWPYHASIEDSKKIVQQWLTWTQENKPVPWMLVDKERSKVIGTITVDSPAELDTETVPGRKYLGYCLSADYWGRGLMPEAVQAVLQYLAEHKLAHDVVAFVVVENIGSKRVLEKCGFTQDPEYTKTLEDKGRMLTFTKWKLDLR